MTRTLMTTHFVRSRTDWAGGWESGLGESNESTCSNSVMLVTCMETGPRSQCDVETRHCERLGEDNLIRHLKVLELWVDLDFAIPVRRMRLPTSMRVYLTGTYPKVFWCEWRCRLVGIIQAMMQFITDFTLNRWNDCRHPGKGILSFMHATDNSRLDATCAVAWDPEYATTAHVSCLVPSCQRDRLVGTEGLCVSVWRVTVVLIVTMDRKNSKFIEPSGNGIDYSEKWVLGRSPSIPLLGW